jgi:hypothetical protein
MVEPEQHRGVVFDLGANMVSEFSSSPFASREATPDGPHVSAPLYSSGGDDAEAAAERTMQYARMLGMDLVADSDLVWIADEMARAELPPGWAVVAAKGGGIAFLDTGTQIVSEEHPTASYYRKLFQRHRAELGRADTQRAPERKPEREPEREPERGAESDSSLDSEDSDYEERLARRRARSRRRRSSGSYSDSDSDKENDSARERDRERRRATGTRKAARKSVRQQIMEKAEQKSQRQTDRDTERATIKPKTPRASVLDSAAELSREREAQRGRQRGRDRDKGPVSRSV